MQHSIFAMGSPTADFTLEGIKRDSLSQGAWVDYLPNWVGGHESIFDSLCANVDWHRHRREMYDRVVDIPRLTGSSMLGGGARPMRVAQLADALSEHYERPLTSVSYAYYRSGEDSVAMHGDKVGRLVDNCLVAIVAVGAPRRFLLREVGGEGSRTFSLGWGDLLVMGGTCQKTWRHGVPKVACSDPRISIMFRQSLTTLAGLTLPRRAQIRRPGPTNALGYQ
jgi:alkylated DNA repair dioxygenase AlkB